MTPQTALQYITDYGSQAYVPDLYRKMDREMLKALAEECERPTLQQRLDRQPIPRLNYNPLDRALGRETPPPAAPPAPQAATPAAPAPAAFLPACPAEPLPAALAKALANPRRLDTPVRQRTAFLRHLRQCGTVAEAAARAGVNRGSLYRWRAKDPDFAARWAAAIARHADEVGDDIVLQANQVEIQPVFYRGQKIGERRRVNTRLMIHVQNRMDAERRRAEDRAERRALLLLRAELAERSSKIRQPATPATVPPAVEMSCGDLGLAAAA